MMKSLVLLALVGALSVGSLATTGCAKLTDSSNSIFRANDQQTGLSELSISAAFTVTDTAGQPIVGATVLIGTKAGVPFTGNVLTTDANGTISIPAAWVNPQPVTVQAKGFVRTTWLAQSPAPLALQVRNLAATGKLELKGKATGFGPLPEDDWADVGLIFPALKKNQLATLQVSDLVSPEVDTVTVFGQSIDIPSNVSIPKQTERYIFSITLDKPVFRTYVNEPKTWKMVATHARFPFELVVDKLRNGSTFYDVLNDFEFLSASVKDIALANPSTSQDLPITDLVFAPVVDVAAPKFSSQYAMLAVSVVDSNGYLFPTDVKVLGSSETRTLVAPKASTGYVLGALRDANAPLSGADSDAFSAMIAPSNQTTRFEFLDLPAAPKLKGNILKLSPPSASVSTISAAATYATLSLVDSHVAGKTTIDTKSPMWDVYGNAWSPSIELPELSAMPKGTYRWEVMFGGAPAGTAVTLGPNLIDNLTHVTKSALDL